MTNRAKTLSAEKKLFITHSWPMVQSSLALLYQLGESNGQDFLILTNPDLQSDHQSDKEIVLALAGLGHSAVTWELAQKGTYEEVHIAPAHALGPRSERLLANLNFSKLVVHSDGFRNGVFVHHKTAGLVDQIIKFGINLEEEVLKGSKVRWGIQRDPLVVSFSSVESTWAALAETLSWKPRPLPVGNKDLLVCERYWGAGHYRMKKDANLLEYLSETLKIGEENYRRIIFRPTLIQDSYLPDWKTATAELASLCGLEYVSWEEVSEGSDVPQILNHPEAQFFLGGLSDLGGLFAFDGSLSFVVGARFKGTRVHWADGAAVSKIFKDSRATEIVLEQSHWMRTGSANLASRPEIENVDSSTIVATSGRGYFAVHHEVAIDAMEVDKDAQIADKDAQIADKDASLSWRITKPLRTLGKLLSPRRK